MKYGYARVSTADQCLDVQREALQRAGCEVIREEKRSGTTLEGRDELRTLLEFLRPGDTLVVTRIDRLARSLFDLQGIVQRLNAGGIHLAATEQPIDTSHAAGKAFLDMLGVFAEFERNISRERQREGIEKAKAEGKFRGGRKAFDDAAILALLDQEKRPCEIVNELGCSRMTIHRAKEKRAAAAGANGEAAALGRVAEG